MKLEKEFVDFSYKPKPSDVVCLCRIEPAREIKIEKAAANVALESSVGTWDKVAGLNVKLIKRLGAKVYSLEGNYVKIAYPLELFELGNMPSILSGIAGNIFGMNMIKHLRLEDVSFPKQMIKSFKGPKYGIDGIRKKIKIYDRPLVGTIVKPKLGLGASGHANYAYQAWKGGLDLVKSDENLTNQSFNRFKERFRKTIKMKERVEKETGEKKIYVENVTAETKEMKKRARFIQDNGGNCAMVDVIVTGWSSFQTIREENLDLFLHVHRAGHGMFTEDPRQGMSMLTVAKLVRIIGGDNLHIGAIFGKMKGGKEEVRKIGDNIRNSLIKEEKKLLGQDWYGTNPMFAVCSGGLHPGLLPKLINVMGKETIYQAGGGVGANRLGIIVGAKAMRQAVDAAIERIPIREYAKKHKELNTALDQWGS